MTSLLADPPEPDRLAGLDRDLREDQLQPRGLEHRLGEILLADRSAAGDDHQIRSRQRLGRRRLLHRGQIVLKPAPRDDLRAHLLGQRRHAQRKALRDRARPVPRRAGLGQLVAGAEDDQPRPLPDLDLAKVRARGGDQRARIDQRAGCRAASAPRAKSPARLRIWRAGPGAPKMATSPSRVTSSWMTTRSAPSGIGPPVKMRSAPARRQHARAAAGKGLAGHCRAARADRHRAPHSRPSPRRRRAANRPCAITGAASSPALGLGQRHRLGAERPRRPRRPAPAPRRS